MSKPHDDSEHSLPEHLAEGLGNIDPDFYFERNKAFKEFYYDSLRNPAQVILLEQRRAILCDEELWNGGKLNEARAKQKYSVSLEGMSPADLAKFAVGAARELQQAKHIIGEHIKTRDAQGISGLFDSAEQGERLAELEEALAKAEASAMETPVFKQLRHDFSKAKRELAKLKKEGGSADAEELRREVFRLTKITADQETRIKDLGKRPNISQDSLNLMAEEAGKAEAAEKAAKDAAEKAASFEAAKFTAENAAKDAAARATEFEKAKTEAEHQAGEAKSAKDALQKRYDKDVGAKDKEIKELSGNASGLELQVNAKNAELEAAKAKIENNKTEAERRANQIATLNTKIDVLERQKAVLEADFETQLKEQIRAKEEELTGKYATDKGELVAQNIALAEEKGNLQKSLMEKDGQIAQLDHTISAREPAIAGLNQEIADLKEEKKILEGKAGAAEQLKAELEPLKQAAEKTVQYEKELPALREKAKKADELSRQAEIDKKELAVKAARIDDLVEQYDEKAQKAAEQEKELEALRAQSQAVSGLKDGSVDVAQIRKDAESAAEAKYAGQIEEHKKTAARLEREKQALDKKVTDLAGTLEEAKKGAGPAKLKEAVDAAVKLKEAELEQKYASENAALQKGLGEKSRKDAESAAEAKYAGQIEGHKKTAARLEREKQELERKVAELAKKLEAAQGAAPAEPKEAVDAGAGQNGAELERLSSKNAALTAELDGAKEEISELKDEAAELKERAQENQDSLDRLKGLYTKYTAKLETLNAFFDSLDTLAEAVGYDLPGARSKAESGKTSLLGRIPVLGRWAEKQPADEEARNLRTYLVFLDYLAKHPEKVPAKRKREPADILPVEGAAVPAQSEKAWYSVLGTVIKCKDVSEARKAVFDSYLSSGSQNKRVKAYVLANLADDAFAAKRYEDALRLTREAHVASAAALGASKDQFDRRQTADLEHNIAVLNKQLKSA